MSRIQATAPSNIALIKYMGKTSHTENRPSNPSLSWSLNHLTSVVELEATEEPSDRWEPLDQQGYFAPTLSEKGQTRFLDHFQFLKSQLGIEGHFIVRSGNNFPADCGVASSASSFAALTKAAWSWAKANGFEKDMTVEVLSGLSRQGSGSSCRSLFSGWARWEGEGAEECLFPLQNLEHTLVLLDEEKKEVSSSEAHKRVTSSPKFQGRVERATKRLKDLEEALKNSHWKQVYQISLEEFEDMHDLFETSDPPFSYRNQHSRDVTQWVTEFWNSEGDGPVITMDAGANIHLLWRPDQLKLARNFLSSLTDRLPTVRLLHSPGWEKDFRQ